MSSSCQVHGADEHITVGRVYNRLSGKITQVLGVPRILENTLPPHFVAATEEWKVYEEYLQTTRVNINVRQVFPKGFDPGLS